MDYQERKRLDSANKLKTAFNLLWDQAYKMGNGVVTYRDMLRISDAIRSEGSSILELKKLPTQIDIGLNFACATLDPNKARAKETLKNGVAGLGGAGGLALAWICLGQVLSPPMWAVIVAWFTGGIAAGPMAIAGVAGGILIAAGAVYAAFQKMTPQERTAKAYSNVIAAIDNWVKHGCKTDVPAPKIQSSSNSQNSAPKIDEKTYSDENLEKFHKLVMSCTSWPELTVTEQQVVEKYRAKYKIPRDVADRIIKDIRYKQAVQDSEAAKEVYKELYKAFWEDNGSIRLPEREQLLELQDHLGLSNAAVEALELEVQQSYSTEHQDTSN